MAAFMGGHFFRGALARLSTEQISHEKLSSAPLSSNEG
jgi:hypothetical protein